MGFSQVRKMSFFNKTAIYSKGRTTFFLQLKDFFRKQKTEFFSIKNEIHSKTGKLPFSILIKEGEISFPNN